MNKGLKVVIYIVLLTLLFLAFSRMFKSCGAKDAASAMEAGLDTTGEVITEAGEDLFEAGEDMLDSDDNGKQTYGSQEVDYDEYAYAADKGGENTAVKAPADNNSYDSQSNESETTSYEAPASEPSYGGGNSYGQYMIITGSYLLRENAQAMTNKLNNLGYNDASISVFQNSQYNSVIAARYDNYENAVDAANELKRRGVDAYVHKKK